MHRINIFRKQSQRGAGSSGESSSPANASQTSSSSSSSQSSSSSWDPDEENIPPSSSSSSIPATPEEVASAMPSSQSQRSSGSSSSSPSPSRHGLLKEEHIRDSVTRKITRYRFHCHCGKVYSQRKKLVSHVRAQQIGRVFRCQECSKYFNTNQDLKKHLKQVHDEDPPYTYGCHGCGKQFASFEKLKYHRKFAEHPEVKLGKPTKGTTLPQGQQKITRFFRRLGNNHH